MKKRHEKISFAIVALLIITTGLHAQGKEEAEMSFQSANRIVGAW